MRVLLRLVIPTTILMGGCGPVPQNAAELRTAIDKGSGKKDVSEVDRPLATVSNSFEEMGPKCFNKRVESTSTRSGPYGGSSHTMVWDYRVKVTRLASKTEMSLQQEFVGGVISPNTAPEGGFYVLVADAEPAGNKTRITIYGSSAQDTLFDAIKAWAEGGTDCPDLSE